METVNIGNKNDNDIFYRYKRPKLCVKYQGKGNGQKTIIENIDILSHSLSRENNEIMKHFSYEIGTSYKSNILNGHIDINYLEEVLNIYINKFILCNFCGNPETNYIIKKKNVYTNCKACGSICKLDEEYKLYNYIFRKF